MGTAGVGDVSVTILIKESVINEQLVHNMYANDTIWVWSCVDVGAQQNMIAI